MGFGLVSATGDVASVSDEAAINQSIRNLIMMERGDVPFHPEIHTGVRELIFENWNDQVKSVAEQKIRGSLSRWERRIDVVAVGVSASPDENEFTVDVSYRIRGEQDVSEFKTVLRRLK